jgi:hypothetical protein
VTITRFKIQLDDVFGKEPAGAFKKAQRLIEYPKYKHFEGEIQVNSKDPLRSGTHWPSASSARRISCDAARPWDKQRRLTEVPC